ncbi:MAG: hypothetical protein ACTHJS_14030 [Xanthobacteraceae bacterium]|jgi:hypothetical protein
MSDYDYRNPEDPFQRDTAYDPNVRTGNSAWGWVAAAVFVAIVLAVVFGMGHQPGQNGTNTAMNQSKPPATTMAPPATTNPTTSPSPATPSPATPAPANPAPPVTPAPSNGAQH